MKFALLPLLAALITLGAYRFGDPGSRFPTANAKTASGNAIKLHENEIRYLTASRISGIPDPRRIQDDGDWTLSNHLWGRLLQLNENGQEIPYLARHWVRSADGLTWTFEFPERMQWSDGSPLTTEQIARSLRLSTKGTTHTHLKTYLKRVYARDDRRVVFELKRLPANFLMALTFADYSVTDDPHAPDAKKEARAPRTTGPYRLLSSSNGEIVLEPNPHFLGFPKPPAKRLRIVGNLEIDEIIRRTIAHESTITVLDSDTLPAGAESQLKEAGFREVETSPAWTIALRAGAKGLTRIPDHDRRWLQKALWLKLSQDPRLGTQEALGVRQRISLGGLKRQEWIEALQEAPDSPQAGAPVEIELAVMKAFEGAKSFQVIRETLESLGARVKLLVFDPSVPASAEMKRKSARDYDFIFMYEALNEPDPDTLWRYAIQTYALDKKPVTQAELDEALFEHDLRKREALYHEFEQRNLRSPFLLPIRKMGSKIFVSQSLRAPSGGHFEAGVDVWKFSLARGF